MSARTVLLVDMNAFFASVEQRMNPLLRGKPIAVCGHGRTVVTTASYEARARGVRTGMNLYEARRACPEIIPVIGDIDRYVDVSLRLHRILLEFTDLVEPFSIDECFMDVTHCCRMPAAAVGIARRIKERILEEHGLYCSVGIGPNRVVAKLASNMQKPDGLVEIPSAALPGAFADMPVEGLQGVGVGRKTAAALRAIGIGTVGQLATAPLAQLTSRFGVTGRYLQAVARGEDETPVRPYGERDPVKSVGHMHTLPRDTGDLELVRSYLRLLAEKAGARLRQYGKTATSVNLVLRYADFRTVGAQRALAQPVRDTRELYVAALDVLKRFLPLSQPVRLVGLTAGGLAPDTGQGFLFDDMIRQRAVTDAVDRINRRFGELTVKPLSVMLAERHGVRKPPGMLGTRGLFERHG